MPTATADATPTTTPDIYDVLLTFQLDPPTLVKDTSGQVGPRKYQYVELNQVVERVVRDRLNKAGCIVLQPLGVVDGLSVVSTTIMHVASQTAVYSTAVLPDADTPQDAGKACTYMRRYSLVSLLCLIGDEDDDGHGFQRRQRGASASTPATSAPMPPAAAANVTGGDRPPMEL